jgi:hypothetical protein
MEYTPTMAEAPVINLLERVLHVGTLVAVTM